MKKSLWDNGVFLSLLVAVVLGGFAFWRSTGTELAVQKARIDALERQVEKLTDGLTELWQQMW